MPRHIILAPLVVLLAACDVSVNETHLVKRIPVEAVPQDAREVGPGTYLKIVQVKQIGAKVSEVPVFGFAETINPQSPRESVTSLEEGRWETVSPGLRPIFADARIGETRRVWNCLPRSRVHCQGSEYTFYLEPE